MVLRGQSKSSLQNYLNRIARISLHFGCLPEDIAQDEINEYLVSLALDLNQHIVTKGIPRIRSPASNLPKLLYDMLD